MSLNKMYRWPPAGIMCRRRPGGLAFLFFFLTLLLPFHAFPSNLQFRLDREFSGLDGAIAIVDLSSGKFLGSVHPEILLEQQHSPGSLLKPFAMLAYYMEHGDHFPTLLCPPASADDPNGCWDRNGHGKVSIERAISYSCNVYFRQLAEQVSASRFDRVLQNYELTPGPPDHSPDTLIGKNMEWKLRPILMLRAYAALYNGGYLWPIKVGGKTLQGSSTFLPVRIFTILRKGMGLSPVDGTSMLARREAKVALLGKTGTTLLTRADGKTDWQETQGWWIGLHPSVQPKIAVMTFVRRGRGATHAAPLGGKALALYLQTHP